MKFLFLFFLLTQLSTISETEISENSNSEEKKELSEIAAQLFSNTFDHLGKGIYIQRNHNLNSEKKIAIVTVIISGEQQENSEKYLELQFKDIVAFGTRSKELYAKKNGYDFIIATKKINECFDIEATRNLESAWTKLPTIVHVLDDYDWVFLSDADSIILDFNKRLEDFLNEDFDVIACTEKTIECEEPFIFKKGGNINTGQVFYKNCKYCKELILGAWNMHHKKTPGSFDQARINRYIKNTRTHNHILVYPPKAFNINPSRYEEGDFIVHMYEIHGKELHKRFKEYEKKYGYILDEIEEKLRRKNNE